MSETTITKLGGEMTTDIFVVAENLQQFQFVVAEAQEQWKNEIKQHRVHYVADAQMLKGIRGARIFLAGQYFKRKDWAEIEKMIKEGGHRSLLLR